MTIKEFEKQIIDALTNHETIVHILESENSLLINCNDKSSFLINILESKFTFVHNEFDDKEIEKYLSTHSEKEFAKDLLGITENHPAFFLYFMLFTKLEEKGIIDKCLYYHILDNIIYYEQEFEKYIIRLLCQFNSNKNEK